MHVVDTDAQFHCGHTPLAVLSSAKAEKKRKHLQACQDQRATFTPLCMYMSVDGMMGHEATVFLRWLADRPWPIMLKFLPIMLLSSAQKSHPLCSILCP